MNYTVFLKNQTAVMMKASRMRWLGHVKDGWGSDN